MSSPGLILGKWTLGEQLGRGEFGEVFSTTDPAGHNWAIKVCKLERGPKEKKVKGLTQSDGAIGLAVERRVHQLQLPGLPGVPALPPGCYGDAHGHRYLAMQRMSGNLKEKLERSGGALSASAAAHVAASLLATLQSAHQRGFVYQDLKPANVMLGMAEEGKGDSVYVVDWGCCRTYVDLKGNLLTAGGDTGNDMFRSIAAHGNSAPAPRDDLEALGYLLVWMMAGKLPWEDAGSQAELIARKAATTTDKLCGGLPPFVKAFVTATRAIGFAHARDIDYTALQNIVAPHLPPVGSAVQWAAQPTAARRVAKPTPKKRAAPGKVKEPKPVPDYTEEEVEKPVKSTKAPKKAGVAAQKRRKVGAYGDGSKDEGDAPIGGAGGPQRPPRARRHDSPSPATPATSKPRQTRAAASRA